MCYNRSYLRNLISRISYVIYLSSVYGVSTVMSNSVIKDVVWDFLLVRFYNFYPRDAMLARVIAIATCLSVRLSVRHAPVLCLVAPRL